MEVGVQRHTPAALTPQNDQVSIVQDTGWAPGLVWTGSESLLPFSGFDPRTVQPVASLYRLSHPSPRHPKLFQFLIPFYTLTELFTWNKWTLGVVGNKSRQG